VSIEARRVEEMASLKKIRNRYVLLEQPGVLTLQEAVLSDPILPGYVRLKVAFCGICGSDLAFYQRRPGATYPRTLGHEYSGVAVGCGDNVNDFQMGDTIAVDPNYRCGSCKYCMSGNSHLCNDSEANLFSPRGLAFYVDIHQNYLHKIPDFNPPYLSALIEPLSCSLHAIELAQVDPSDQLLVLGCGSQGSMITFGLAAQYPGLSLSVYDPNHHRARSLHHALPNNVLPLQRPPVQSNYSLIFEASGEGRGFRFACQALQKRGRMVVLSRYHRNPHLPLPYDFPRKEPRIIFSHLDGDGATFRQAIELLKRHWSEPLVKLIDLHPLSEVPALFPTIKKSVFNKTIIKITD
jgi:(R,R)-butanediol dehydrogenase / meso-butanediol dehydrogenase / diacetyl reductase